MLVTASRSIGQGLILTGNAVAAGKVSGTTGRNKPSCWRSALMFGVPVRAAPKTSRRPRSDQDLQTVAGTFARRRRICCLLGRRERPSRAPEACRHLGIGVRRAHRLQVCELPACYFRSRKLREISSRSWLTCGTREQKDITSLLALTGPKMCVVLRKLPISVTEPIFL